MDDSVDIVVVAFNEAERLDRAVASIFAHSARTPHRVTVVDNGSTDATGDVLARWAGRIDVVALDHNVGFARAFNLAARRTAGRFVVRLDHDALVTAGWLDALAGRLVQDDAALVGPKILTPHGFIFAADCLASPILYHHNIYGGEPDLGQRDYARPADLLTGCCWMVRRDVLERAGYADEAFFPGYAEDFDFCASVRAGGGAILYDGGIAVVHDHRKSDAAKHHLQSATEREANLRLMRKWRAFADFPRRDTPEPEAIRRRALVLAGRGEWAAAAAELRRASAMGQNPAVLHDLARVFLTHRRWDEARSALDETVQRWPDDLFAAFNLVVLVSGQGRTGQLRAGQARAAQAAQAARLPAFLTLTRNRDRHPVVALAVARTLQHAGDDQGAARVASEALTAIDVAIAAATLRAQYYAALRHSLAGIAGRAP